MKAHIGVDADSGLVHAVVGTAANVNDLNVAGALLHGEVEAALGGAGYLGVHKRPKADGPTWYVAMHPTLRRRLNPFIGTQFVAERVEETKTSIRAEVEHPFRGAQASWVISSPYRSRESRCADIPKRCKPLDYEICLREKHCEGAHS
jgi:hypothetical protein